MQVDYTTQNTSNLDENKMMEQINSIPIKRALSNAFKLFLWKLASPLAWAVCAILVGFVSKKLLGF